MFTALLVGSWLALGALAHAAPQQVSGLVPSATTNGSTYGALWHKYRWYVVGTVAVIGTQTALILMLFVQRRRRLEAQAVTSAILAALPGETAIIDASGTIVRTNDTWAAAARAGADSRVAFDVGANYLDACGKAADMPGDVAATVHDLIASVLAGERDEFAVEYLTSRHDERRWFEIRVHRLADLGGGAAVMNFDVTARREAEAAARHYFAQMVHVDRVAGMGHLASALAHELNQPLTAMLSNAQAARRLLASANPDLTEVGACLSDIVSDDRRAAEIIRRMRQMLKKTDFRSVPLPLNDLVSTTIGLVSNDALLHGVSIEFKPAAVLSVAYGDLVQIQQVILNLLTNAITSARGGTPARTVRVWTASAARYVEVGVHDSGGGIAPGDLERVFEPFFTTKEEGLGMGLAISRTIIEAHGGRLVAENHPAGGAIFRACLRINEPETAATPAPARGALVERTR